MKEFNSFLASSAAAGAPLPYANSLEEDLKPTSTPVTPSDSEIHEHLCYSCHKCRLPTHQCMDHCDCARGNFIKQTGETMKWVGYVSAFAGGFGGFVCLISEQITPGSVGSAGPLCLALFFGGLACVWIGLCLQWRSLC